MNMCTGMMCWGVVSSGNGRYQRGSENSNMEHETSASAVEEEQTPNKKPRYQPVGTPHNVYTPEQKLVIGKFAAQHGNTKAAKHFSEEFGMRIVESTVRQHKKAYYTLVSEGKVPNDIGAIPLGEKVNMELDTSTVEGEKTPKKKSRYQKRGTPHNVYTPEQKAMIGKYAAEHGNTRAAEHFSEEFGMRIVESTVRQHKKAYYAQVSEGRDPHDIAAIPSKRGGPQRYKLESASLDPTEGGMSMDTAMELSDPSEMVWKQDSNKVPMLIACDQDIQLVRKLAGIADVIAFPSVSDPEQLPDKECSEVVILAVGAGCIVNRLLLDRCPKLRVIVCLGIGYNHVDVEYAGGLGIIVCNVPDYCIEEVADTAFAHILGLFRQTVFLHQAVCRGELIGPYKELSSAAKASLRIRGKTLGLVGLGKTGTAVALRAKAFGFNVIFYDPFLSEGWDKGIGGLEQFHSLTDLVKRSDCVSLHCMLTPESYHIIDESMLRIFKRGAFLVNVSQGGLVDESTLANALKQGWIAGAALDVHENEPFSLLKSPLKGAPNLICTPHVAWYSKDSSEEFRTGVVNIVGQAATSSDLSSIPYCVNKQYILSDAVQARWN